MDDTILRVDDIQKFYGNKGNLTKAVDHISFSVRKGEFLGIMGSSGSGKTTLLNCISTIDTVTSGHIYVEGKDIILCSLIFTAKLVRGRTKVVLLFLPLLVLKINPRSSNCRFQFPILRPVVSSFLLMVSTPCHDAPVSFFAATA